MTKLKANHGNTGLDQLDVAAHPARDTAHFRRIIAARRDLGTAEQDLRDAVKAAREAGRLVDGHWCRTRHHRQAAQQRFGSDRVAP